MKHLETIRAYYKSFETNDRKTLERILDPDFIFLSDYAEFNSRDRMLKEIWLSVINNTNKMTDLEIFRRRNSFIVKYNLLTPDIIPMVEYIVFENDKISKIEVFSETKSENDW